MHEFKECRHVMPNGLHCKSPAMRGSAFCYFHGRTLRPALQPRPLETNIEIPAVIGSNGCAGALNQILQALANNRISSRRAAILLQGVQMASGMALPRSSELGGALENLLRQGSKPKPDQMIE